jgi:hypothetical protein
VIGALAWVHDRDHIERVREASKQGTGWLDSEDCRVSPGTFSAALATAGLAMQAALDMANGRVKRVFVVARPPAHHARSTETAPKNTFSIAEMWVLYQSIATPPFRGPAVRTRSERTRVWV